MWRWLAEDEEGAMVGTMVGAKVGGPDVGMELGPCMVEALGK